MNTEFEKFVKATGGGSKSAKDIGVHPVDISLISRGERGVSKSIAKKIVDKYPNISLYHLLYGDTR